MVRLDFSIALDYDVIQPTDFDFMLHAARTPCQQVVHDEFVITPPAGAVITQLLPFQNWHARFSAQPGPLHIRYAALVEIDHHFANPDDLREIPVHELSRDTVQYLRPSRYCPSDRFVTLARQEFGRVQPGYERVLAISLWVRSRTRFQVGVSGVNTCSIDTFSNGAGVCRDFAHLMICMCRALDIPARYVTGLDYGADPVLGPMDFHAYVEVFLSGRWYLFDPTGICVPTGLIRLAYGRDANDAPFATYTGHALWSMPVVKIRALDDEAAGISLPAATDLAISTSGESDYAHFQLPVHDVITRRLSAQRVDRGHL